MASKLAMRLAKNSKLSHTAIIEESKFFNNVDKIFIHVPIMRLALSGQLDGFFIPGATMFAGPSKHGKSILGMLLVKAYMDFFKDSVCLFFDSEFGTPKGYFNSLNIDTDRVVHAPIKNIEELKFDLVNQLESIEDGEKVIVFIDSIGNTASKKEVQDAIDEKSTADMTRAKQLKSLFRIATPYLRLKNIPMVVINHTYQSQDLFPKTIVGGGCMVEGTEITLSDGTLKQIQNMEVGDIVKTLLGDKEVTATWNPDTLVEGEPECYKVVFDDGFECIVSENHEFLMKFDDTQYWVAASDLSVGDDVVTSDG